MSISPALCRPTKPRRYSAHQWNLMLTYLKIYHMYHVTLCLLRDKTTELTYQFACHSFLGFSVLG